MSATTIIAAHLAEQLPDLKVLGAVTALPNMTRPVVYVASATLTPRTWPLRDAELAVWLIVPEVDPVKADATLDTLIDRVLDAIDAHPVATWSTAERTVYGDNEYHAYRITVSTTTTKET